MARTEEREMIEVSFDKDKYHLQNKMIEWCRNAFGPEMWCNPKDHTNSWGWDSAFGHTVYYFKNEQDFVHFSLVWSM